MPYYHLDPPIGSSSEDPCGGRIAFWSRKCESCGFQWPVSAMFAKSVPEGMSPFRIERESTSYAKWAEKFPGVPQFAGSLPNWPRWARIFVSVILFLMALWFIFFILRYVWGII